MQGLKSVQVCRHNIKQYNTHRLCHAASSPLQCDLYGASGIQHPFASHNVVCRCPYYRTAEQALYGTLTITGVNEGDSTGYADTYWDALPTTTLTNSQCGIDLPNFPNKLKSDFMTDPNNPACGEYLQFTSQYPGSGPCYPVLVPTVDHLNRYVHTQLLTI